MRIIFMGTPDFAVPSLQAIYRCGHDIVSVVTQPDKQRGRGKKVSFPAVKECALALGLPVLQPVSVKDDSIVQQLQDLQPDVIIVIAYGKILPKAILDIPRYGCLNVHGSLLPKYRGAAPIQRAVYDGAAFSGITIMLLDEGMDTGKILKQHDVALIAKETTGTLFDKLAAAGAETLTEVLADLEGYESRAVPQDHALATYTEKITKEMAAIDWMEEAAVIERLIRTLDPQPGAYCFHDGKRLKIWSADVIAGKDAPAGTVIDVSKKYFSIQTGKNALKILEVQPESRNRMAAAQFLQSNSIAEGQIF